MVEPALGRVAILWQLAWADEHRLVCSIYRDGNGLQLRLESDSAAVMSERFALQPRAVAKAQALRASLKRRGWRDAPADAGSIGTDPVS